MVSFKGQSAIEYLMTYGWMLLVVAIVGGAIITTVQQQSNTCESRITDVDAQSNSFGVTDFGYSGNNVDLRFVNNGEENVNLTGIRMTPSQGGSSVEALQSDTDFEIIRFGDSTTIEITDGLAAYDSGNCGEFDVSINYSEAGIDNSISGKIQDTV
jgi:hypothetical protein